MTRRTSRKRTSLRRNLTPLERARQDAARNERERKAALAWARAEVEGFRPPKYEREEGTYTVTHSDMVPAPHARRTVRSHAQLARERAGDIGVAGKLPYGWKRVGGYIAGPEEGRRSSRGLRRNTSNIASKFFTVFSGILTQDDQKEMARETKRGGRGNIYRLGHYLAALHRVEESVRGFQGDDVSTMIQVRAALEVFFAGSLKDKLRKPVDAYLEHGTFPKYPVSKLTKNSTPGCAYCQSPPGRHRWWCKKLAKNSRKRTSRLR